MFVDFFMQLKAAKVPVSLREYLTLLEALEKGCANYDIDDFYYLARSVLVKDERNIDRFDRVFAEYFRGIERSGGEPSADIPEEWLRKLADRHLTEAEKAEIEALGGWDKLMETLRQRLAEPKRRHQGGSKWIGTAGTSHFGAWGYNPEGVRIGQEEGRHRRAVKVWDRREFRNLDDSVVIGTRNIKVALKRLRRFVREGAAEELDLDGTIRATAHNGGWLDLKLRPERHNRVKLLLFLDVGGSMTPHTRTCEELFSAARSEFKHLEYFYFHNCPYESLWRDNRRRREERLPTREVINTFGSDYKVVFVGDAAMSPYEIAYPGGSVEHWNEEAGAVWVQRLLDQFPDAIWLNPEPEQSWTYVQSTAMIRGIMGDRMFPLTLEGLEAGMRALAR